ncbi:hypothetical protein Tco_0285953 [Tanacetum coccineum]
MVDRTTIPTRYKWVPKTKMKWVPKVRNENVKKRVSFAIDNASRITNVLKITNTVGSNLSCIPSSFNSLADCTVHFGNDQFALILGYGDLVQGNLCVSLEIFRKRSTHRTFKFELSQNMQNLERQLNNKTFHEKDSKSALSVIKVQFDKFLHLEAVQPSHYDGRHKRENFKDYTQMEAQTFKDTIIQNIDSIEQCIVERARHEQEIQNRLNERKLQIQECKIQEVKASDASLGDKDSSGIHLWDDTDNRPSYDIEPMAEVPYTVEYNVFDVGNQHFEQPENINDTSLMEKVDINTTPDSSDMCNNEFKDD